MKELGRQEQFQTSEIIGIDIDSEALNTVQECMPTATVFDQDFLTWSSNDEFDIIIGNPPYISKKNLTSEQADLCKKIHIDAGLAKKEVSNIWTSFVIKSTFLLNRKGILAFVLPTELLQVKYAEEIRDFLLGNFTRVEIISFKKLAFHELEQDTVLLFAYKTSDETGVFFTEVDSISELQTNNLSLTQHTPSRKNKWTSFILGKENLEFIHGLISTCNKISDYCTSVAGIVTAANNFFIVSQKTVFEFNLARYVKPIIQKGMFVNGSAQLTTDDYNDIMESGKPCFLIDLKGVPEDRFNQGLQDYLALGLERRINERYKCKKRDRWHDIPVVWNSDAFFFKRGHSHPKLIDNQAGVFVTDSAYRIRTNKGISVQNLVMSFYNSLTLLCSELFGRYYGGGVLELTPNEFKRLPLPYSSQGIDYNQFIHDFSTKHSIENFLLEYDQHILGTTLKLQPTDITRVQELYRSVKGRRLRG